MRTRSHSLHTSAGVGGGGDCGSSTQRAVSPAAASLHRGGSSSHANAEYKNLEERPRLPQDEAAIVTMEDSDNHKSAIIALSENRRQRTDADVDDDGNDESEAEAEEDEEMYPSSNRNSSHNDNEEEENKAAFVRSSASMRAASSSSSGWLPKTPHRHASSVHQGITPAGNNNNNNNNSMLLRLQQQERGGHTSPRLTKTQQKEREEQHEQCHPALSHQKQYKMLNDDDDGGNNNNNNNKVAVAVQTAADDHDDQEKKLTYRDETEATANNNSSGSGGEAGNTTAVHYEVRFPPSQPQFSGLIYEGDRRHDTQAFRSSLPFVLQAGVQKAAPARPPFLFSANSSLCRHHVVAVEGADSAFVALLRSGLELASDETLREALPRCFNVSSSRTGTTKTKQEEEEKEEEEAVAADGIENDSDDDPVAYFRKNIIPVPASLSSSSSSRQQQQHQNRVSNCIVVSLRAGIPNRGEETIRCVITTSNILEGEHFLVDAMSIFRAFDDEHWIDPEAVPQAAVVPLFANPPASLQQQQQHNEVIRKRLVGETAVPRGFDSSSAAPSLLLHDQQQQQQQQSSFSSFPRLTVELQRWPRPTYHHGVGANVRQHVGSEAATTIATTSVPAPAPASASGASSSPLLISYPARMLELRPCAALNGELEVVAGPKGVPYGTALLYGGTLATPKKSRAMALVATKRSSSNNNNNNSNAAADRKKFSLASTIVNTAAASANPPPTVDVEKFIYSYEVGSHGRVILGNTIARYINHKLNFSPSGNVQFVNLPASRLAECYDSTTGRESTPKNSGGVAAENGDDDDNNDDSDAVTNRQQQRALASPSASSSSSSSDGDDDATADDANNSSNRLLTSKSSSSKKQQQQQQQRSKGKKKSNNKKAKQQEVGSAKHEIVLPFFLVARDIAPGEPLLADSYGSSYDGEMERYIACSSAPMSAADVEAVKALSSRSGQHEHQQQQEQQQQQQQQQISASSAAFPPLPLITCGYNACYRNGVDRGSILAMVSLVDDFSACRNNNNNMQSTKKKKQVSLFYVHSVCWGDVRKPKDCRSPDDPLIGTGDAAEFNDDDDANNDDHEDDCRRSLLFAGLRDEDLSDKKKNNSGGGMPIHAARLKKYFARSAQSAILYEEQRMQQFLSSSSSSSSICTSPSFSSSSSSVASVCAQAIRSCVCSPRFVLAERLCERTEFTQWGEREIQKLTSSSSSPSSSADDIGSSPRVFYRAASPSNLHAKATESNNAVSLALSSLVKGNTTNNSNNSSNAYAGTDQSALASSLVLLDAASCVLLLPQRDGIWPVTFSPKEHGGGGGGGGAKKSGASSNLPTIAGDLECVVLTSEEQLLNSSYAALGSMPTSSRSSGDNIAHDAALFSYLRAMEPKVTKK